MRKSRVPELTDFSFSNLPVVEIRKRYLATPAYASDDNNLSGFIVDVEDVDGVEFILSFAALGFKEVGNESK